jgi:hypothetical protein
MRGDLLPPHFFYPVPESSFSLREFPGISLPRGESSVRGEIRL